MAGPIRSMVPCISATTAEAGPRQRRFLFRHGFGRVAVLAPVPGASFTMALRRLASAFAGYGNVSVGDGCALAAQMAGVALRTGSGAVFRGVGPERSDFP